MKLKTEKYMGKRIFYTKQDGLVIARREMLSGDRDLIKTGKTKKEVSEKMKKTIRFLRKIARK